MNVELCQAHLSEAVAVAEAGLLSSSCFVEFSGHVSIKNINIHKLKGSGAEKVSLTFPSASPQTASEQLSLTHCPGPGEAGRRGFYHVAVNYHEGCEKAHPLGLLTTPHRFN